VTALRRPPTHAAIAWLSALLLPIAASPRLCGQEPSAVELQLVWRAGAAATAPPALAECLQVLAKRPEWPTDLAADAAFELRLSVQSLALRATAESPPAGSLWAGSLRSGDHEPAVGEGRDDGTEDWWVPQSWPVPSEWWTMLQGLGIATHHQPRTLDIACLLGQLAGPTVEGDPNRRWLELGSQCGELTFASWPAGAYWRVRARSDGGLLLPACLLWLHWQSAASSERGPALRLGAARDSDRAEAARQLLLSDRNLATPALRAALHGEDELRLAAITTLVRQNAASELPRIVAAGETGEALALLAAQEALVALWPAATKQTQTATQQILQRSEVPALRQFLGASAKAGTANKPAFGEAPCAPTEPAEAAAALPRAQWLLALGCLGAALYGCWLRERRRAQPLAPTAS